MFLKVSFQLSSFVDRFQALFGQLIRAWWSKSARLGCMKREPVVVGGQPCHLLFRRNKRALCRSLKNRQRQVLIVRGGLIVYWHLSLRLDIVLKWVEAARSNGSVINVMTANDACLRMV